MHIRHTVFTSPLLAALSACSCVAAEDPDANPAQQPERGAVQPGPVVSLEALKERAEYAALDKQAVEAIARAAEAHWADELSGFDYQRVEHFSAGGVAHWMSIWSHRRTGLEFVLLPGGKFQMGSPASEPSRGEDELRHWVTLDPFSTLR